MSNNPRHPEFADVPMEAAAKAERLAKFVGSLAADDAETVAFWRDRSAAEHAEAGAQLSAKLTLKSTWEMHEFLAKKVS